MPIVTILSFTPASQSATIQQPDGTILSVPVSIDFSNLVGMICAYDTGVLTITPQPPVKLVAADPTVIIDGALIYNTTAAALKVGSSGAWVTI